MAHQLIRKIQIIDTSVNSINLSLSNIYTKNNIDSSIYNKITIDGSFSNYYNKTQVDTSLNSNYYSRTQMDNSFNSIYSKNYIDTSLNNIYTKTYIDSSFNSIYNKINNLGDFYNRSYIDNSFNSVYTKTYIDNSYNSVYNKSYIDNSFNSVYTKIHIDNSFNNVYTKTYIDNSFNSVYTKVESDQRYTLTNLLLNSSYDENVDISINSVRVKLDASYSEIKSYIDTNFYSKTITDASFYTKSYIDSSFSNVYTKTYIDSSFATYSTKSYLDSSLNNYALKTYVDSSLNNYALKNYVDSSLNSNYILKSRVDSSFNSVYTKTYIDSSFTTYATKSYIDSSLNNYALKTYVDSSLNNYALKTYVDSSLNNYALKTYVDSSLNSNYSTKNYIDSSINNFKTNLTSALNYAQTKGSQVTVSDANLGNSTIVSVSITTNGYPILVMVSGDANNLTAGGWVRMNLFRGTTAIGNTVQAEGSSANENSPYCIQVIDTPTAGTYTYSLKTTGGSSTNGYAFGEAAGPVISAIELAGTVGPGANDTQVQTGITISATTTAPTTGTRGIDKIEYQILGNRVRLTYRLGYSAGSAGSGEYLISLPTGMKFNTTYDQVFTGTPWNPIRDFAKYLIPVNGGNIISGGWPFVSFVVPYDNNGSGGTGRFRFMTTNNGSGSAYFWGSSWYQISTEGSWVVSFDIWV